MSWYWHLLPTLSATISPPRPHEASQGRGLTFSWLRSEALGLMDLQEFAWIYHVDRDRYSIARRIDLKNAG